MSVLRTTKAPISMRNGTLQLKLGFEISGEALWSALILWRFVSSIATACG
jgi:hypothetical protein